LIHFYKRYSSYVTKVELKCLCDESDATAEVILD